MWWHTSCLAAWRLSLLDALEVQRIRSCVQLWHACAEPFSCIHFLQSHCNMLCHLITVQLTEACESCDVTMWPFFVVPRSFSLCMLESYCQISILASLMIIDAWKTLSVFCCTPTFPLFEPLVQKVFDHLGFLFFDGVDLELRAHRTPWTTAWGMPLIPTVACWLEP